VPQLVCLRVDPVQGVGGVVVVAVPAAADLAVVVGKSVISQGLLKNLMLTWTTIMQVRHRCRPNLVSSQCWYFNIKFEGGAALFPLFVLLCSRDNKTFCLSGSALTELYGFHVST
jgi:hypothetical protein